MSESVISNKSYDKRQWLVFHEQKIDGENEVNDVIQSQFPSRSFSIASERRRADADEELIKFMKNGNSSLNLVVNSALEKKTQIG